jgi:hypothetical protein
MFIPKHRLNSQYSPRDKPGVLLLSLGHGVKSNPIELIKRIMKALRHLLALELIPES